MDLASDEQTMNVKQNTWHHDQTRRRAVRWAG